MNDGTTPTQGGRSSDDNIRTEPSFKTPEEIAKFDRLDLGDNEEGAIKPSFSPKGGNKNPKGFKTWLAGLTKKQKILLIAAVIVVLGGLGAGAFALFSKSADKPAAVVEEKKEEPKTATPIYSPLTGVVVTKEQSETPVTAVMIENSPDARPQAGLHEAGVVFEAIAEGGITRFMALYQETQPDYIGPIRSVRPYYLDWMQGFDAAIAHVGGSAEALARIRNENIKDLDQSSNSGPYKRVSNRYAPHNMYSSIGGLLDLQKSKGYSSKFTGFPRKPDAPAAVANAKSVDIKISSVRYNTHYDYDAATNSYKRVMDGKPHVDERSKTQLNPKVVVAMVMPYSIHPDRIHSVYGTIGSGKAYVFQDGTVTEATWEKASAKAQITFKDAAGKPIAFNAGQTWLTATAAATNVTFGP